MAAPTSQVSQENTGQSDLKLHFGVARVIGSREYQEDEYACIDNISNGGESAYFAIFDGHGSDCYSAHASNNTHKLIFESEAYKKGDYTLAILEGLKKEDDQLFEKFHKVELGGSTATVSLIVGNKLYLGNLGDSSSVLAVKENGYLKGYRLSKDHKPTDPEEKQRIEGNGGQVRGDRVIGPFSAINMSRAIGDFMFKMPLNRQQGDWIASMPHLLKPIALTPDCMFMILASDGLWNVLGDKSVEKVYSLYRKGLKPTEIATQLANECGNKKHADNTTVIVVFFDFEGGKMFSGKEGEEQPGQLLISEHTASV